MALTYPYHNGIFVLQEILMYLLLLLAGFLVIGAIVCMVIGFLHSFLHYV
jgi:hypothetical protein